mgnify:FL=1
MKVISLDQSISKTGISVFEFNEGDDGYKLIAYELFVSKGTTEEKIFKTAYKLQDLIIEHEPTKVLIEDVQLQVNAKTYKSLSQLQGVLFFLCYRMKIACEIINSSVWRKGLEIKGKKRDELKEKAKEYVFNKYGLTVEEDVAESICIGTYYFTTLEEV